MIKKQKPSYVSDKFYVQITTPEGNREFRRYNPKKYARKNENLPDGWVMVGLMRKEHWEDRRKYFRKKWWPRFLSWVRKYKTELTILIFLLGVIIAAIALFI